MKVSELIEALKALPQDADVVAEGHTCDHDVAGVHVVPEGEFGAGQAIIRIEAGHWEYEYDPRTGARLR